MKSFKRILEIRSHELTEGRDILFTDTKTGKQHIIYKEDQREAYFGAIDITLQLMRNRFDEDAKEKIGKLEKDKKEIMGRNLLAQFAYWAKFSPVLKKESLQQYGHISKYSFNDRLPYRESYFKEVISLYDQLFGELNDLIERKDLFKGEGLALG